MKRIYVAEDDKFLASAYKLKLTKAGFIVQVARDGQALMDMVKEAKPDLIVLDIIMPVKDGFAVLQELKADQSTATIPVIVASNLGQKEDIETARKLGANDFIVKSDLHLMDVITKINKTLGLS